MFTAVTHKPEVLAIFAGAPHLPRPQDVMSNIIFDGRAILAFAIAMPKGIR